MNNTELKNLIDRLRKSGKIRYDSEIAESLDIPKSNLSLMMSGKRGVPSYISEKLNLLFPEFIDNSVINNPQKEPSGIPIYEAVATASGNNNVSQSPEFPAYYANIKGYEDCDFGLYIYENSMYPTIESGNLVLCKKISDKSVIKYGEAYVIRTKDYLMAKRLKKSQEKSSVLCVSDNEANSAKYESFDLPIDKILDLYIIKGIIKKIQS